LQNLAKTFSYGSLTVTICESVRFMLRCESPQPSWWKVQNAILGDFWTFTGL